MRIIHCLSLMSIISALEQFDPKDSNMQVTIDIEKIVIRVRDNQECKPIILDGFHLTREQKLTAFQIISKALLGKQMHCYMPQDPLKEWSIPENPPVKAHLTQRTLRKPHVYFQYNCMMTSDGTRLTHVTFSKRLVEKTESQIWEEGDLFANYFCLSVYDFIWHTVEPNFGQFIFTRLPVPESAGSSNAISTDPSH
jgi:hypothetical protein